MNVEVILKEKYNPNFYEFGFGVNKERPANWQRSNVLNVPSNGVYTIYIRNIVTKKEYTKIAIVNCKDGENSCIITVEELTKGAICAITVPKIVKLDKVLEPEYFLKISKIEKVGVTGCRYEIWLDEPFEFKNLKTYNLQIRTVGGQVIKNRAVELDTSVYDRIGTTLIDDGITSAGDYVFSVSTTYQDKNWIAEKSVSFISGDLCQSADPCQGKTDPEWTVVSSNYCKDGDLVVDKMQMNECHTTEVKGTIKTFVIEAGAGSCNEETSEPPVTPSNPSLNPDVYAQVDHENIKIRVRNSGASGTYTGKVFLGNTEILSRADLFYNGYCEINSTRFVSSLDLCGKTLRFVFSRNGHSFEVIFFVPIIVLEAHRIDTSVFEDSLLIVRATKNFDSDKFVLTDIGQNLGMKCFYFLRGSIYHDNDGIANATILSPVPVPSNRYIDIVKFMIDGNAVSNINSNGWKLWFNEPQANKNGAVVSFKIYSAENQIPQIP